MTISSDVIRQSDLLHQLVLDRNTLEELGRVEVLWMYPPAHRVLGFICKSGFLGNQKSAFQLKHIDALGINGLMMSARPEKTTVDRVRRLESLIDYEVWSDEGNRVGKITDCLLNWRTGEITAYLLVSAGWASVIGEVYQLPPDQILSFGNRRILVAEAAISDFALYQPGISQKISQASEFLKEEAAQEWAVIAQRAEETTEQAKEQLQQLTDQAKVQAQRLSRQMKARTQVWFEQAREKTQILAEQMEEQFENLSQPEEDHFESSSFDADDWFDFDLDEEPVSSVEQTHPQPRSTHSQSASVAVKSVPSEPATREPATREPATREPATREPATRESRAFEPPIANPFPAIHDLEDDLEEDAWADFDFEEELPPSGPNQPTSPYPAKPGSDQTKPTMPPVTSVQHEDEEDDLWI